jgi:hypothetical protein
VTRHPTFLMKCPERHPNLVNVVKLERMLKLSCDHTTEVLNHVSMPCLETVCYPENHRCRYPVRFTTIEFGEGTISYESGGTEPRYIFLSATCILGRRLQTIAGYGFVPAAQPVLYRVQASNVGMGGPYAVSVCSCRL